MKDEDKEVRRKAVLWILRARREFNEEEHPRQFILTEINLQAASYIHHLCFKQAQPKMCHSPKVDDGVYIFFQTF